MDITRNSKRIALLLLGALALQVLVALPAAAYPFTRPLKEGDRGADVRALEVRVAGWYPNDRQQHMPINSYFASDTTEAVKAFQSHYGLVADGIAGPATFARLNAMQKDNGSTIHFKYGEFKQNFNSRCSARANAYAGTFDGGMTARRRTKRNVRRLMWRLEALRAKGGNNPIGVNSGFRSVAYNDCIGGARASQHLYGTAADNRMAEVSNRRERNLAKGTQFHGIGCYSTSSHNHFDTRLDNKDAPEARYWWWPERDKEGRDLADDGRPCFGESTSKSNSTDDGDAGTASYRTTSAVLDAIRTLLPGAGSLIPSVTEVELFQKAGEPMLNGTD